MAQTYEELLKTKCSTKQELMDAISSLPDDVIFEASDGDVGGYDVSIQPYVALSISTDDNTGKKYCRFGHLEYFAYQSRKAGLITEEQYSEFVIN